MCHRAGVELDDLSRRIVGALQVDGRASWRRIAAALGESPRTVARRGAALLESGAVRVVSLPTHVPSHVLRVRCDPDRVLQVAESVSAWRESVFAYSLTSAPEMVAELMLEFDDVPALMTERVLALEGVRDYSLRPIVHCFKTVARWRAGGITEDEIRDLESTATVPEQYRPDLVLDDVDRAVIDVLVRDGRIPLEDLARAVAVSEATLRRRLDNLRAVGAVHVRAVVEPAALGLRVEAVLQIECSPGRATRIGALLTDSPWVRYAVLTLGDRVAFADVAAPDLASLQDLISSLDEAQDLKADLVLEAHKRSGVPMPGREH